MGTESNPGQSRPAQVYPWAPGFYLWASVSLWISTGPFLLPPPPPLTGKGESSSLQTTA